MDLSVISYLLIFPALLLFLIPWKPAVLLYGKLNVYHRAVIFILTILLAANVLLFHYWGSMINYRALTYLADPGEILNSFSTLQMIAVFLSLGLLVFISWLLFKKITKRKDERVPNVSVKSHIAGVLILSFALITGIRGGWQMLPMNESLISYSSNNYLNQAALNPVWHLMYDVQLAGLTERHPFNKMDKNISDSLVAELYKDEPDTFPKILSTTSPNIVLVILESHTADVIAALGGEKNVSPTLDSLSGEGLLFSSIISSGSRTDQGIVSLLNGWPATPYHSIMRSTEKSKRLPSLPKDLKARSYHTAFYYGGESNFSNMNLYLQGQTFDEITERKISIRRRLRENGESMMSICSQNKDRI